jgi:hypothetical protein
MPIPSAKGEDGSTEMPIQGVFPVDINTDPMTYTMPCTIGDVNGSVGTVPANWSTLFDSGRALMVASAMFVAKPSTGKFESLRTPTVFKIASANAINDTALWTPAGGKRFRLMGFTWTIPNTATAAAGTVITLRDAAADIFNIITMGNTTAGQTGTVVLPGNGYLSAAADQVLNIHLSAALTVGVIAFSAFGTEE